MSAKPDIEVYVGAKHFTSDNWCARCAVCGVALTKFCFEEIDARREGAEAMKEHDCAKAVAA